MLRCGVARAAGEEPDGVSTRFGGVAAVVHLEAGLSYDGQEFWEAPVHEGPVSAGPVRDLLTVLVVATGQRQSSLAAGTKDPM